MAGRTLSLILVFSISWCLILTVSAEYNQTFGESTWEYIMNCRNEMDEWFHSRNHRHYDEERCTPTFDGIRKNPINLVYKVYNDKNNNPYPLPGFRNEKILSIITSLDLSDNQLSEFPPINQMDNLVRINFSKNYFRNNVTLAYTYELPSLKEINLSHNNIITLQQNAEKPLGKLENINLSYNNMLEVPALDSFGNLTVLDLSYNRITALSPKSFEGIKKLINLNMSHNSLSNINASLFRLTELKTLDLSENKLINVNANDFNALKALRILNLKCNIITSVDNEFNLQNLHSLDIGHNELDALDISKLEQLVKLSLQNNNINSLKGLNKLLNLRKLDLSNNKLINIEFEKGSLINLELFSIRNNYLTVIKHEHFQSLVALQVLDLSDNQISLIELYSFETLKNLISFQISNNPLNGTLKENTFEGLNSLPDLDISYSLFTTIQNGSFSGMFNLTKLNISHSKIETLEFNSFIHSGPLKILDLSHNNIKEFIVNNTHFSNLTILNLNNNHIKTLSSETFSQMVLLSDLNVSYNEIENIYSVANLSNIRSLDLSYNPNLLFNMQPFINKDRFYFLDLSGTKTGMSFQKPGSSPLSYIKITDTAMQNITSLKLNDLITLLDLILSHNQISKVESGCFSKLNYLINLDLSFNQITYIEPGVFKDNTALNLLNISHNYLTTIHYGIFSGPSSIRSLDISYNKIDSLQDEQFYDLKSLSHLIADHNRIETIEVSDFLRLHLQELSIGDNPMPCNLLVSFQRSKVPFKITAINLVESNHENVKGVTCNKNIYDHNKDANVTSVAVDNENIGAILMSIRDILLNKLGSDDEESLANKSRQITTTNYDNQIQLLNLTKLLSENNKLNMGSSDSKSVFIATCVALTLLILVCLVLFKFYRPRMFMRKRLSESTMELLEPID